MLLQNRIKSMHSASTDQKILVIIYPKIYWYVHIPPTLYTDKCCRPVWLLLQRMLCCLISIVQVAFWLCGRHVMV